MKLGVFTPVFQSFSFEQMFRQVARFSQIAAIELGTGGWPGSAHVPVEELLANPRRVREYKQRVSDAGLIISALSCHGNPVHPDTAVATRDDETFRKTVRLAEMLDVAVVVTFSGCPAAGPEDKLPNWITAAWPPEYSAALEWQWHERLIPYWRKGAQFASDHGIKVAIEAHPGFAVYNPETLLRLREATGPVVGINLDPSHLWWQGIDIPAAIRVLGDAIFHFHAKDVGLVTSRIAENGVLDVKNYRRMNERSWNFRSVGWGHSEIEWKAIVSALRLAGYDYVISIEHEDGLASIDEGLGSAVNFLSRMLLTEPPVDAWWA